MGDKKAQLRLIGEYEVPEKTIDEAIDEQAAETQEMIEVLERLWPTVIGDGFPMISDGFLEGRFHTMDLLIDGAPAFKIAAFIRPARDVAFDVK